MQTRWRDAVSTDAARLGGLCLAYALTGKLGLLLAVPPGYATAIFPAAGIAVTALLLWGNRLWPGVLLGSLSLNVWIDLERGPLSLSGLQVAVSVGVGAALQALGGGWLVRRFVGFPSALSREADIVKFMLLAGPLACLLNATVGVVALYATGVITESELGFSWFNWWVGDSIGVLITAPLMLIAFSEPRGLWRSRRTVVAVPLLLALSAVVALFHVARRVEQQRIESGFRDIATDIHEKIRYRFSTYVDSVAYVERFVTSSERVTRETFRHFVAFSLASRPGIQGLSWNPVVPHAERDRFEHAARQEGFPTFQITERDGNNNLVRAGDRSEYVAVQFIEPLRGNESALGFDVASNPERRTTLLRASDSGRPTATSRVTLVQGDREQAGFLIIQPVYRGLPRTAEERAAAVRGFAVGVFRVGDIVDAVLRHQQPDRVGMRIEEVGGARNVHLHGPKDGDTGLSSDARLEVGGRHWVVRYWPTLTYLAHHRGWQAWGVLAIGLLLTSLLGVLLLAMTGRAYQVEGLVTRRTAELRGILTTAIEAIVTLDAGGTIESVNPAGEALFGYASAELVGSSILTVIPDFFAGAGAGAVGPPVATGDRRDAYALKKDGTRTPIGLATSSVALPDRTIFTAIVHDLTERQRVDRMKDEFVSTVSHELRTPLTSIRGALGLITGGALDEQPEQIRPLLAIAYENCGRLARLVDDLLTFNKLTLAESPLTLRVLSVHALVEQAITANQGFAAKYGATLSWTPSAEDAFVDADEDRLVQVLSNVLSNALKYSPQGGRVLVSIRHGPAVVRISVSDSGPGIPLEFQDRVFEKFAQADSSNTRRVGGTGLGMAISKALVEQHGGRISFVSQPGHGTTFHIDLPTTSRRP